VPRVRGIEAVAVGLERRPCGLERVRRPGQVSRDECDLGFRDHASRARQAFSRTERPSRAPKELLGAIEVAELRHRDAAQCQGWRIIAECDPLQGAEGITSGQRVGRGCDW
jgi:hypothetical protein